jgi:paraquat-inducible protein A
MTLKSGPNIAEKSIHGSEKLIACHECDRLHRLEPVPDGGKAACSRCGATLYKQIPNSMEKALALNLAALVLFIMANVFPFLSLEISGRMETNILLSGSISLYRMGMGEVALLVFFTSFLFPLMMIISMLCILLPLRFGYRPWHIAPAYRLFRHLSPWSLLGVFMLGVLISIVKLMDLAVIIPGISLYAFAALMVVSAAAIANFDDSIIWSPIPMTSADDNRGSTAIERRLVGCHTCSLLVPLQLMDKHKHSLCPRCGSALHSRKSNSITRTWALIFTAAILFIPANLYPVMTVTQFGRGDPNTILSGVIHLIEGGMWGLAMIIFFASIVVPVLKLSVLTFLLVSIQKKSSWRPRDRTLLYRITEGVGAWSMVDIYVVAILAGLVNFGSLSTIRPGIGAVFFGIVVVATMVAAHNFDPRLIWDNIVERS